MFTATCGKSEAEKQARPEKAAEEMAKAAEGVGQAAAQAGTAAAAQGMRRHGQGHAGHGGGDGRGTGADGKPVEPVAFQTLQTHLPKVSGWEMDEPEGERMTTPMPFSQVEADYRKGDNASTSRSSTPAWPRCWWRRGR